LPVVTVHGEAIPNAHPLFPLLAGTLSKLGVAPEISTRVLSLCGLLGLAALVLVVTYRTCGNVSAAACAGAMMLTSLLAIDKAPDGFSSCLLVLVIFAGHLLWYYYAAVRGDWSRAWMAGFAACAVGFYISGLIALVFFIGPLIFMRRPLGIFRRRHGKGIFLGLGILFVTILAWYLPYHVQGVKVAQIYPRAVFLSDMDYLKHLLTFPADMLLRLVPWLLLAWAPFCVALQALDKAPMFSRFLRTLCLTGFFLIWVAPMDDVYLWMMPLPPLAILTGLYYEINIRRHGHFYRRLAYGLCCLLLPGSALVLLGFYLLPPDVISGMIEFEHPLTFCDRFGESVFAFTCAAVLLLLFTGLLKMREKPPVWCCFLLVLLGPLMVFHAVSKPYMAQDQQRRDRAEVLSQILIQDGAPAGTMLYKYQVNDLYTESIYMKNPIKKLTSLEDLPGSEKPVIYLFTDITPIPNYSQRSWRSLLPHSMNVRGHKLKLWRGTWQYQSGKTDPGAASLLEYEHGELPPRPEVDDE